MYGYFEGFCRMQVVKIMKCLNCVFGYVFMCVCLCVFGVLCMFVYACMCGCVWCMFDMFYLV